MNAPPPTPKRRRRKLIAALVLLALLLTWWFFPRGDSWLVGKWQFPDDRDGYWHLQSNGLAVFTPTTPGFATLRSTWQFDGNLLQIGRSGYKPRPAWQNWIINEWNWRFSMKQWIDPGRFYKVLSIERDILKCVEVDDPENHFRVSDDFSQDPLFLKRVTP